MGSDPKDDAELTRSVPEADTQANSGFSSGRASEAITITITDLSSVDCCMPRDDEQWPTIECAQAHVQAFAESQEFPYFKVSLEVQKQENHFLRAEITNYPLTWLKRYRRCGYAKVDPEPAMLRASWSPFAWDELRARTPAARRMFEDAAVHGLVEGFTVPIHCANGEFCALTLMGPRIPQRPEGRWALYHNAYRFQCVAFARLRRLLQSAPVPPSKDQLTERQRHILLLLMQGLSVKSIARSLGLHTRTIDDGLRRACMRLGVSSREQAIVRALATRQIDATGLVPQAVATVIYYVQSHSDPLTPP